MEPNASLDSSNQRWVDFLEHCSFCRFCDAGWIDAVDPTPQSPEPVCVAGRILYQAYVEQRTRMLNAGPHDFEGRGARVSQRPDLHR